MVSTRKQSITRKLTRMNLVVSGAALLFACIAFFTYDWITFRDRMITARSIEAQIIAANTASALVFNDPRSAQNTLGAMRASPRVVFAGIYTPDGKPFAGYWRDGKATLLPVPSVPPDQLEVHWFQNGELALASPLIFQGKRIGIVYIRSDLRDMEDRLFRYTEIVGVVLLMSLLAALVLSDMSQRRISSPIVELADLAGRVSRDKNYSARAAPAGDGDELSMLIDSFNEMLAQIQQRDSALQYAHDELEARVRERTAELEKAQQDLRALSGRLIQMQDDERRRIARELHDSAGQILIALKLNLAQIQRKVQQLGPEGAKMAESLGLIDELTQELRTISHLLHPPLLDELGLVSAVRWYVEGFAERSKIGVDLELDSGFGRLSRELETTVFRIVQECLTNIHRHSGSATASIRIVRDEQNVTVEVRDYGKGMPADRTVGVKGPITPGVGIQGMRERVRQLGGRLEFRTGSSGTAVLAMLPVVIPGRAPSINRIGENEGRGITDVPTPLA
jgi:signal transduction histidine kinase